MTDGITVDVRLIEPEAAMPDGSGYSPTTVTITLLYSIAISLKKLRVNQEWINTEQYGKIIRDLHG